MNPADEAAVEAAKANEEASRTYAKGIMSTARESYQMFQESAEQALAQRYTVYAKTGNVSTEVGELPESGVPIGPKDSETFQAKKTELEAEVDRLTSDLADLNKKIDKAGGGPPPVYDIRAEIEGKLSDAQKNLEALGPGGEALAEIRQNAGTGHLSGSDLLTEVSYRDLAQRHGYTMFRTEQNKAVAAEVQGENFNTQANYLEDAATYNMWTTILGGALKIAGTIAGFV